VDVINFKLETMNIYLLHVGYVIAIVVLSIVIVYLMDVNLFNENIGMSENGGGIILVLTALLSTVMLLLSYY